jgi:hypothetical protein
VLFKKSIAEIAEDCVGAGINFSFKSIGARRCSKGSRGPKEGGWTIFDTFKRGTQGQSNGGENDPSS